MAFPTTSVLTSFTGTDEDPLSEGGNWTGPIRTGKNPLRRVSNTVAAKTAGNNTNHMYWTTPTFGPDTEVFLTISTLPGNGSDFALWARVASPASGSMAGYVLDYVGVTGAANDTWDIYKFTSDAGALLGSLGTQEVSAGDKIGFEVVGSGATVTCRGWYYNGSSWAQVGSDQTDSTGTRITAAGFIGIEASPLSSPGRADDFGGGTVVVPTVSMPRQLLLGVG